MTLSHFYFRHGASGDIATADLELDGKRFLRHAALLAQEANRLAKSFFEGDIHGGYLPITSENKKVLDNIIFLCYTRFAPI